MSTKTISWSTGSGNITLTYQGQGDGPISIQSDANNLGSARSQVITVETVGGAITRDFTVNQAACPFPVGDVKNFSYTGSYQEVTLPVGKYKLQCWGAQGGTCSDGYSGGKGGYSESVITLSSTTTVRVYVGGQGGSTSGGFNGGGSSSGSSSYNSGDTYGRSSMGGGGGATDIRLSDGALLSRMIVAGGGSGGAYVYKRWKETEYVTESETETATLKDYVVYSDGTIREEVAYGCYYLDITNYRGWSFSVKLEEYNTMDYDGVKPYVEFINAPNGLYDGAHCTMSSKQTLSSLGPVTGTVPSNCNYIVLLGNYGTYTPNVWSAITFSHQVPHTTTQSSYDYSNGYAGGGTNGIGYSSSYYGKQNAAGKGGSFGQGANQATTNYRYCSGAGGGGWYGGGGGQKSNSSMTYVHYSGGGSGWVNIAANAGNRPSGYTGLELDSGTTYDGNTSFPSTSGGTETGHSGNGYARITRIS